MRFIGADRLEEQRVRLGGNDSVQSPTTLHGVLSQPATNNHQPSARLRRDDPVKAWVNGDGQTPFSRHLGTKSKPSERQKLSGDSGPEHRRCPTDEPSTPLR